MKPRSEAWWLEVVSRQFSEQEWKVNFRVSRATFMRLCNELRPYISRRDTSFRRAVPTSKRVAVCLWRLAGNSEYRTISHLFGIGRSTACSITNEVCRTLVCHLLKRYIKMPTGDRLEAVISRFKSRKGFPQVGGAIDGTHIPIKAPVIHPDEYYNRKSFHSVVLQAVVDSYLFFTDICVGWPGRVHDARVFANSLLFRRAQALGSVFPDGRAEDINGLDVPVILLGDSAYPLLPWLMKPFPNTGDRDRQMFNYRLSSTRMVVERAFGQLKGRFRILNKQQDTQLENVCNIVAACCILHNYCLFHDDHPEDDWMMDDDNDGGDQCDNANLPEADGTRDTILQYLIDNPA